MCKNIKFDRMHKSAETQIATNERFVRTGHRFVRHALATLRVARRLPHAHSYMQTQVTTRTLANRARRQRSTVLDLAAVGAVRGLESVVVDVVGTATTVRRYM